MKHNIILTCPMYSSELFLSFSVFFKKSVLVMPAAKRVRFREREFKVTVWATGVSKTITLMNDDEVREVTIKDFAILARDAFSTDELAMGYFSFYKVNLDKLDMIEGKGRDHLNTDEALRLALEEICSSRSPFEFSQQHAIYIWPEQTFEHKSPENLPCLA